jgi:hypothetical protein
VLGIAIRATADDLWEMRAVPFLIEKNPKPQRTVSPGDTSEDLSGEFSHAMYRFHLQKLR